MRLARVGQDVGMLVSSRVESGQWVMWRVGRRRLAWRPRSVARFLDGADGPLFVVIAIPLVVYLLASWVASLVVTLVVWPARVIHGRWPVVAYLLDPPDGDDLLRCAWIAGRAEADAIVQRWVVDIRQRGGPEALTGSGQRGRDDGSG